MPTDLDELLCYKNDVCYGRNEFGLSLQVDRYRWLLLALLEDVANCVTMGERKRWRCEQGMIVLLAVCWGDYW